jgi:hypothetical protein
MQRNAGVPSVVTQVVQGLVILLSLGFGAGEVRLLAGRARSRPLAGEPAAREP